MKPERTRLDSRVVTAVILFSVLILGSCCMNTTSEILIYKARVVSDSCAIAEVKLFVSHNPKARLLDSSGNLLYTSTDFSSDTNGRIYFEGGYTQSRCPSERPDYLHSAPLLLYFDHPTCADYYDSLPAARLKELLRVTPEEAGYIRRPKEEGVWLLPTLHIEPDTAYFDED